jgi:hypothetical protein
MVRSAHAWKLSRTASLNAAVAAMARVAVYQRTSWHPEAGPLWDAHEQLAELFLLRSGEGDAARALAAYEAAIRVYPGRYRSLAGAAHAAELVGNTSAACAYNRELLQLTALPLPAVVVDGVTPPSCPAYEPDRRPELKAALAFVGRQCV